MTRRRRNIILLLAFILACAALVVYVSRPQPVKVLVAVAETGLIEEIVANTRAGTVNACRRAKLAPGIGGQIAELPVKEGMQVKQGQLLLTLWNQDLQAQALLAANEAQAAKARAKAACLQAETAQRQAKRFTTLQKTHSISEDQVDQAVTEAKARSADCDAAQESARVSEAQEGVIRAQLDRTLLKAPFDGVIAEVNGEVGEYVTPSPLGVATLPAIDLVDTRCFYITAPIDEVDAAAIRVGMQARITLDAFKNRHFEGRVKRIANYVLELEKQARTVDIEVEFSRPEDMADLMPGYSADAEVILQEKNDTLRVPTAALLENNRVFAFMPTDNVLEERTVETGLSNWDYTEVVSGLNPGDQVVTSVDREGVKAGAHAVVDESESETR